MASKKKSTTEETINVLDVQHGTINVYVVGVGDPPGLMHNAFSEKVKHALLYPSGRKTTIEKQTTMKHDPLGEFRETPYKLSDPAAPTLLAVKAAAFKKAMCNAALDLPGMKKAQIGRLVWVNGSLVPVYGVPKISAMGVRTPDINRTPDIRFRAIQPEWACTFSITFVQPVVKPQTVIRLLAAAGLYIGVGDGRNEKGALHFGGWRLAEPDDAEYRRIVAEGGRAVQETAMDAPEYYDDETADLITWFDAEVRRRSMKGVS